MFHHSALALIAGARKPYQVKATVAYSFLFYLKLFWSSALVCIVFAGLFLPPRTWAAFFAIGTFLLRTYMDGRMKKRRLSALRKMHLRSLSTRNNDSEDPDDAPAADRRVEQDEDGSEDSVPGSEDGPGGSPVPSSPGWRPHLEDESEDLGPVAEDGFAGS